MKAMHLLYAHAAVFYVIRLEDMGMGLFPPEFIEIYCETTDQVERRPFSELVMNRVPYTQRGWCIAEVQWMSAKSGIHGYAPLTPAMFQERVKRGLEDKPDGLVLKFTHRDDLEAVVRLQEKVFLQHSQKRKRLQAHDLPLKELQVLAETLPSFENLEILSVVFEESVDVDFDACIATLRAAIPLCKGLRTATVVQRKQKDGSFRKADLLQA
ncbi:unnamed protein product [Symbiodinium sp. CCMP2456]|nr:unnamed protein product [Symbiodinium sp. CCMP2456]